MTDDDHHIGTSPLTGLKGDMVKQFTSHAHGLLGSNSADDFTVDERITQSETGESGDFTIIDKKVSWCLPTTRVCQETSNTDCY